LVTRVDGGRSFVTFTTMVDLFELKRSHEFFGGRHRLGP
jgi:hypothetical protein